MQYPKWLCYKGGFMDLPRAYQEWFVRWYYYDHTEETKIPDTIPIENIEDYIAQHLIGLHLFCAKGFASARNVDAGDNLDFKNDSEFHTVAHYVARLFFKFGIENEWFRKDISKEEFEGHCYPLQYSGKILVHL